MSDKTAVPSRPSVRVTNDYIDETIIGFDAAWRRLMELQKPAHAEHTGWVRADKKK